MEIKVNKNSLSRRCPLNDGILIDRYLHYRGWYDCDTKSPARFRCRQLRGVLHIMGVVLVAAGESVDSRVKSIEVPIRLSERDLFESTYAFKRPDPRKFRVDSLKRESV